MKISVCIPMYNEEKIIEDCAYKLSKYMSDNFDDYEILFSNDGSTDRSVEKVESMELPRVRTVGYEKNHGKGCAVRTAMLEADGDIIMFTDADLAYGTDVIKQVYDEFSKNPDASVVVGSRNIRNDGYEGYTPIRKLASKAYIKVLCVAGGLKLTDSQCGCKAFGKQAAKEIFSRCKVDGFAFDFEAIMWADKLGYKIAETPVKVINHRESKVHVFSDSLKMLKDLRKMKKRIKRSDISSIEIKKVEAGEIDEVMKIIAEAKKLLSKTSTQWQSGYPDRETMLSDIEIGRLYGYYDNRLLKGFAALVVGFNDKYKTLADEKWLSSPSEKDIVVHRIAVGEAYHGQHIAERLLAFSEEYGKSRGCVAIKIDTHEKNIIMQHLIEKMGYTYCGMVDLGTCGEPESMRLAYDKIL